MATAAVIGCGDISALHLGAIEDLDGIELVGVCDVDPDAAARAGEANGVPSFTDHRALLEELRPDVVHICTPHDQHVPVAIDARDAGADVLTEKPLAASLAEAERLVAHAEASAQRIGVCFQNRYNATSIAMKELLDSGRLGRVIGGSATVKWARTPEYYRAKPWRGTWENSGGGLLINQAIHTIDLLEWLLGPVSAVAGHAANHVFGDIIEVEDTAELVLTHEGGVRSVMYATNANAVNEPVSIVIAAENATLSMRGNLTVTWADGTVETVAERRLEGARAYWGASHVELIRDFYATRGSGEPFWISPREAMKPLRIPKEVYAQSPGMRG